MLSLFRFLYKHSFVVFFLLLESIAFAFVIQKNPYQRASFLNSSDSVVAQTYLFFDNIVSYLNLRQVNEYLAAENSKVKAKSLTYYQKSFEKNVIYEDSSYNQEFVFTSAKIIKNSTNQRNNYLTLNRGELNGIEKGMGVVSDRGVIGIVVETSRNFSAVMSILNKESKISAKVKKNNYFGSVVWNGEYYRIGHLKDIPNHVFLSKGDTVVTSGFSAIFPAGIPIGTVLNATKIKGSGFLNVEIAFTEDYRNVAYVHVVKYLSKIERIELESKIPADGQ